MSNFTTTMANLETAGFGEQFKAGNTVAFEPNKSPYLVQPSADYVFDNLDAMRLMCAAWAREWDRSEQQHRKGILFFGPTGSGKSSFVEQFFARLNVPLLRVTWNPKREADQLLSDRVLVDGMLLDRDQALVIAARQGLPVLINELDLADPAELVSLNDVIEKGVITLPNGETFTAKRGFVVFATANTAGTDDEDGVYHGTRSQNASTLRRFFSIKLGYPSEEAEKAFLQKMFPTHTESLLGSVAAVVTKLRQAFEGTLDGKRLSKPISRPETVDWVELLGRFSYLKNQGKNVVEYALGFAFSNSMTASDQTTVRYIVEQYFGDGSAP